MTDAQANINWTTVWRQALPAAPARVLDVGTGTGEGRRAGGLLVAVDSTWFPADMEATADPVRAAGFTHVTVTAVPEIPDRREAGPQFVITARAPWHDRGYLPAMFG